MCQANLNTATWVTSAVVARHPQPGGAGSWPGRSLPHRSGTRTSGRSFASPAPWPGPRREPRASPRQSDAAPRSSRGRPWSRARSPPRTAADAWEEHRYCAPPAGGAASACAQPRPHRWRAVAEGWARRPDRRDRAGAGRRRSPPPAPSGLRRGDPSRCARSPASARFPYPAPAPSQPDEPGRRAYPQGGSACSKVTGSEPISPYKSVSSPHPKRPSHRLRRDPRPVETIHQHRELRRRQSNDPALDRRPGEAPLLEPLGREDQTGAVKGQDLHPIGSLGSEDEDRPRIGVLAQALGHKPCERIHALAEVHRLGGDQHLQIGADGDHARARRVAMTVASVAASTPVGTRTVMAGITISIRGAGTSGIDDGSSEMIGPAGLPTGPSISTGTKAGSRLSSDGASATGLGRALLTCRRQLKSRPWCRRIFATLAPGAKASATIAAFSRADRARRRLPPVISSRR